MSIGAAYCQKYQPTITSHAADNHKKKKKNTWLTIVYYFVSLKQYPNLVQAKDLGHNGMQKPSNVHILRQAGFENVREIPCQFL